MHHAPYDVHWQLAGADHACISTIATLLLVISQPFARCIWRVSDEEAYLCFFAARCPERFDTLADLIRRIDLAK
jgi:hypothetical protein